MANERIPEDPHRSGLSDDDFNRSSRYDRELPPRDRDFDDRASSGGKVALFAVAIALILGAVFYGLNNTSIHRATNPSPAQPTQDTAQGNRSLPQAPAGMRDATPPANTEPGRTTGAAASRPAMPPATAPEKMNRQPTGEAPRQ
jgi:uncharacterized protein HemX